MGTSRRILKFTERCKRLFDAGVAIAKAAAPDDLVGPWKRVIGPLLVEATEAAVGTKEKPDREISLTIKVAGKTLFSAQVSVRSADGREEHRIEKVEKFVPGKWEQALAAALEILKK